ncbi:MAG TPA: DUF3293 domain-containing protein [Burkholderiales bacterium]|nr:DUF3293 domain-containing protein [Burkholderiales bacterium]
MPDAANLDAAYRATTYRVYAPDAIDLTIGARSAALDGLLEERRADAWAFMTAWNPGSRQFTEAENARRQAELLALLRDRGFEWLAGSGVPARPDWQPEESVLVLDVGCDEAIAIAQEFGQVAIVAGKRGGAAELVYCDRTPAAP